MNKMTKAAIAGAAGVALLLGGAGSLALWNAETNTGNIVINAGNLTIAAANGVVTAPTLWVPGDSGTYEADLTITATGDNMKATLEVDDTSIVGGDAALLADLDIALTFDGALPPGITDNGDGTYEVLAGTYPNVAVTVTVDFDVNSANATKTQSVNLTGLKFLLTQVAPTP